MSKPNTPTEQPILSLRVPAELLERVDAISKRTGISRSTLVRNALTRGLKNLEKMASVLEEDS